LFKMGGFISQSVSCSMSRRSICAMICDSLVFNDVIFTGSFAPPPSHGRLHPDKTVRLIKATINKFLKYFIIPSYLDTFKPFGIVFFSTMDSRKSAIRAIPSPALQLKQSSADHRD